VGTVRGELLGEFKAMIMLLGGHPKRRAKTFTPIYPLILMKIWWFWKNWNPTNLYSAFT